MGPFYLVRDGPALAYHRHRCPVNVSNGCRIDCGADGRFCHRAHVRSFIYKSVILRRVFLVEACQNLIRDKRHGGRSYLFTSCCGEVGHAHEIDGVLPLGVSRHESRIHPLVAESRSAPLTVLHSCLFRILLVNHMAKCLTLSLFLRPSRPLPSLWCVVFP